MLKFYYNFQIAATEDATETLAMIKTEMIVSLVDVKTTAKTEMVKTLVTVKRGIIITETVVPIEVEVVVEKVAQDMIRSDEQVKAWRIYHLKVRIKIF